MNIVDDDQISERLKAVMVVAAEGATKIAAARLTLKATESQVENGIAKLLHDFAEIVMTSNSQALRRKVIKSLYWDARLKAILIGKAFGINEHSVHSVAGPLIELIPCIGGCGKQVERESRSHSDYQTNESLRRRSKGMPPRSLLCPDCLVKEDLKWAAEYKQHESENLAEAKAYCAKHGHHWGAEDINGTHAENGVDWVSNSAPISLENAELLSLDEDHIVLKLFCLRWCGATMEKRISKLEEKGALRESR
jgi:hypothetical protein